MNRKILVAVDVNEPEDAKNLITRAAGLAAFEGGELHVLNVVPDTGMNLVAAYLEPGHRDKVRDAAKSALQDIANAAAPWLEDKALHVAQGTVYDKILEFANRNNVATIIVGAHRPDLRDYLIGPNAARVARHAKQSVFVVRAE